MTMYFGFADESENLDPRDPCLYQNAEAYNSFRRRLWEEQKEWGGYDAAGKSAPPVDLSESEFRALRDKKGCSIATHRASEENVNARVGALTPAEMAIMEAQRRSRERILAAQKQRQTTRDVQRSAPPPMFAPGTTLRIK